MKLNFKDIFLTPTDTVMGIGCLYNDQKALLKIYDLKQRDKNKKIVIIISNYEQLKVLNIKIDEQTKKLCKRYWPGAVTFIFENNKKEKIGIRMPNHIKLLKIIDQIGPIYLTSANLSGEKELITVSDCINKKQFKNIPFLIKQDSENKKTSTIYDIINNKILRQGEVKVRRIMKIYIGSDHAGYELKDKLVKHFANDGNEWIDLGVENENSANYANYGISVATNAVANNTFGIVVCGTGIGISIAANKVKGARCALVYDPEIAKTTRQHNNANILALGGRVTDFETAVKIVENFLTGEFESGRHQERLSVISEYESK